jgi:hypothetical protein
MDFLKTTKYGVLTITNEVAKQLVYRVATHICDYHAEEINIVENSDNPVFVVKYSDIPLPVVVSEVDMLTKKLTELLPQYLGLPSVDVLVIAG